MKVYTASPGGSTTKARNMERLGLGVMLNGEIRREDAPFSCALDNGAFIAWRTGRPWLESRFMRSIEQVWAKSISLDFVVAPDIVAAGRRSLDYSVSWFDRLHPAKIALAVQDGMEPHDLTDIVADLAVVFVGGSSEWKWETASQWVEFAHSKNLACHIGRTSNEESLRKCMAMGADSCDSSCFSRGNRWDIIEAALNGAVQQTMFAAGSESPVPTANNRMCQG